MEKRKLDMALMAKKRVLSEYFDWVKYNTHFQWRLIKCEECKHSELWFTNLTVNRGSRFLMTGICGHDIGIVTEPFLPIYKLRGRGITPD